jgi:rhodanese-related sulfurtransferase
MHLNDDVVLYPGHGAGTLCGKGLSKANSSTIGQEKQTNWSLQPMTEDAFVKALLSDQPFIPAYFPYNVELNRKGAPPFKKSIGAVKAGNAIKNEADAANLDKAVVVVDARKEKVYKQGHLPNSVNLMDGAKFETWLGSIIKPGEQFYLAGESNDQLQKLIERAAAIGYESQIKEAFVLAYATESQAEINVAAFKENLDNYTIVDVRNGSEVKEGSPFRNSLSIPLPEVRNRVNEIPTDKPIVVHCAGGYRSAAGSSIIKSALNGKVKVFDLSEAIKQFQ